MISNVLTCYSFFLYFNLILYTFHKNKLEFRKYSLYFIRFYSYVEKFFYFYDFQLNLINIFCDDEKSNYFNNKFKCWTPEHYIYFTCSIICVICQLILCRSFYTLNFNKNESFCASISKFIINNHIINFFYIKNISVFFFAIHKLKGILGIISFTFFILSIYFLYSTYQEYKFQFECNRTLKFHLFLALIYFFTTGLLEVGYLIRKTNFNGLIYVLFVLTLMSIIFFFTISENEITIDLKNIINKDELQIYNELNLVHYTVYKLGDNRKYLLNLASYCQNIDTNKSNDISFLNSFKNNELQYYIYQFIEKTYREGINKYENSIILKVAYSTFLYKVLKKYNKAYIILYDLINDYSINLNQSQQFYIFGVIKKLQNSSFENGNDKTNLSLKYQCNRLINLISQVSEFYFNFWNSLLNSQQHQDINILRSLGSQINKLVEEIEYKYKKILQTKIRERQIILLYSSYRKDILNDYSCLYKEEEVVELEDFFSKSININDINSLTATSEFQFMIISGKRDNFGTILNISQEVCNLLGYSNQNLIGQNMNVLIPDFMRKNHDEVLIDRLKNIKLIENTETALKPHVFLMKNSAKFIFPIGLFVGTIYDDDSQPIIFCKINLEQEQTLMNNLKKNCKILTDENFIIQFFTSNCIYLLGFNHRMINSGIDINQYIKEINDEIFKFSNGFSIKKINKNQMKLQIIKKYMTSKPENIVNFNKKKCKLNIIKLNLHGKLTGYLFNVDIIEKEEEDIDLINAFTGNKTLNETIINNEEEKNGIIKLSKTKYPFNERKDFIDLNKNYIPESEEILFNYNEKSFIVNKGIKKKENLSDILKKEYLAKKLDLEKSKKLSEEESSNFSENSSSDSSITSENFESSFSSEKEKNEESKVNNFINKNQIETDNDYYHVKYNKINYSIYNYVTNTFIDLPKYKKGKVEEIFSLEKNMKQINRNELNNNNKTPLSQKEKIQIGNELVLPELEKRSKIFYMKNKKFFYSKLFSKNINNSVLILIFSQIIHVIFAVLLGILVTIFYMKNKNNLQNIIQTTKLLINLTDNSNMIFSYSLFLVTLQNEKYTNYYYTRETFKEYCRNSLLIIYKETSELITELNSKNNLVSNNNFIINYIVIDNNLKIFEHSADFLIILKEINFAVYNFATTEDKDINFLNLDYNFIFYNTNENLILALSDLIIFMIDKYKNKCEIFEKRLLFMTIGFLFILALCLLFSIKGFFLMIREKEKYLRYFFQIDNDYIRNNISKCQKYLNLNKISNFDSKYFISNPIVKYVNEKDNDEDTSFSKNDNKSFSSFKRSLEMSKTKKHPQNLNSKFISDTKNLKKIIFIYVFYILILISILIISMVYSDSFYKKISHLIIIYNINVGHRSTIIVLYNYLRIFIIYSSIQSSNEYFINKMTSIALYFGSIFEIHQQYMNNLNNNISLYGLYDNSSKVYSNITKQSLCPYFESFSKTYNVQCETLANNISNYGMDSLILYYIHSMIIILQEISESITISFNSGFKFNELLYGTEYYYDILPKNDEDLKKYNEINPFNLINSDKLKNLNILNEQIFKPAHTYFTQSIYSDITNIFKLIKDKVILFIILFFIFIVMFNIIFYFPYLYKKNTEIKQIKQMLLIIPQNILYEILKDDDDNELN